MKNSYAIAGFILSIISLIILIFILSPSAAVHTGMAFIIAFFGVFTFPILGIIFSSFGLTKKKGKTISLIGLILSIIVLIVLIIYWNTVLSVLHILCPHHAYA